VNKKTFFQIFLLFSLVCFTQPLRERQTNPVVWNLLHPIGEAHAYKVQKVCEEIQTKRGPREQCRSVLLNENPSATSQPLKDSKKDADKSGAGQGPRH
jgi:hypothetical protein